MSMPNFLSELKKYNQEVVPYLEQVFEEAKTRAAEIYPPMSELVDDYKHYLKGGKKLRGWEITLGYEMFGGRGRDEILLGSLVIEIAHSFLLIHDDIMDNDSLRRGEETLHIKYAKKHGSHFGISLAINMGDEGAFLAYRLLSTLDFPAERKVRAFDLLSRILMEVGIGQALDITFEAEKHFSEEDVLTVHRYKTAEYTISGPLSIGAVLAGADENKLKVIKKFGIPIGIAFQIKDDELGMFSTEAELGKPIGSDLREAKVTILIVKAFENAKGEDLKFLKHAFGNPNLTEDEVEKVRGIIMSSGALEYSQTLSKKQVQESKKYIPQITTDKHYQQILTELADFAITRTS